MLSSESKVYGSTQFLESYVFELQNAEIANLAFHHWIGFSRKSLQNISYVHGWMEGRVFMILRHNCNGALETGKDY